MNWKASKESGVGRARGAASGVALSFLVLIGCTVELPDVQLINEGGAAAAAGEGALTTDTGAAPGSAAVSGGAAAGAAEVSAAEAQECKGKDTDVGVSGDTIKLGSTFAVSGPVSNISGPILKGVKSYFNKVNAEGGVHGRKLELVWYDDGWDAQRGKSFIKRLVEQDQVFVLTVAPSSNGLDASKSYLEQKQIPVFGTSGLIESQFESPMQWPVGVSTKSASRVALVRMKQLGVQNAAVIWLDLLAGRQAMEALANGVKPIMGKDPEDFLINMQGYRVSISEPDFAPVWSRIRSDTRAWQQAHNKKVDGRPDFVVFAIDPTNAVKALQAAKDIGFRPRVAWGGSAPLFLDLVPQSTDYAATTGLLAGTSYFPPVGRYANMPAVREYVATVKRFYGDDVDVKNPYLEGGYAGAALTVEILKRAGPCLTRARAIQVANSLTDYSAAGLTPPMTFRPVGTGPGHYGNIRAMVVKVSPKGSWIADTEFIADPSPGAA